MMNTYLRTETFEIDGVIARENSWVVLLDDTEAWTETYVSGEGHTFDSLWNYMDRYGLAVPANRWYRALWSKKRRIEFFTKTKTWVDNGTERQWKETYIDEPYKVSMERLLQFDADKVAQYLNERNLSIKG